MLAFFLLFFLTSCTNFTDFSEKNSEEIFEKECPDSYQVDDSLRQEVLFNRSPVLEKYWIEKPDIVHCTISGVPEDRLRLAVEFWKGLGYEFGDISYNVNSQECFGETFYNKIVITIITNEINIGSNLAVTKVSFYTATNEIVSARILMIPGYANKRWILEHEIGHALGWKHFSRSNHIMHPLYQNVGPHTSGLRISNYDIERSAMMESR